MYIHVSVHTRPYGTMLIYKPSFFLKKKSPIHGYAAVAPTIACSNFAAAVDLTSLPQSLSAIAGSNFAAVAMSSLRRSRSIADSNYFAAAIVRRNYVAAVDMTSLQQSLSAIAGSNFAAVAMSSLRQSLSIVGSHDFAAAVPCSNDVAAVDLTSLPQPLSAIAGSNFAAVE